MGGIGSIGGRLGLRAAEPLPFFERWANPDFREVPASVKEFDFWHAETVVAEPLVEEPSSATAADVDFWAIVPEERDELDDLAVDWGLEADRPWFDPLRRENPFIVELEPPASRSMAERRGRWLSQMLFLPEPRRRNEFASFFESLFERFPFQATFRALSSLAIDDVDPVAVRNGCAFRIAFLDTPSLAVRRTVRSRAVYSSHEPEAMLSWKRAVRLSLYCGGDDPSDFIDDDWFGEWLELRPGHQLYFSYLDYIEWKLHLRSHHFWVVDGEARPPSIETSPDVVPLLSKSRTAQLARGQSDIIGVAYSQNNTLTTVKTRIARHTLGHAGSSP